MYTVYNVLRENYRLSLAVHATLNVYNYNSATDQDNPAELVPERTLTHSVDRCGNVFSGCLKLVRPCVRACVGYASGQRQFVPPARSQSTSGLLYSKNLSLSAIY